MLVGGSRPQAPFSQIGHLRLRQKHGSIEMMTDWKEIIQDIRGEAVLQQLWQNYLNEHAYAERLSFAEVIDTVEEIAKRINQ